MASSRCSRLVLLILCSLAKRRSVAERHVEKTASGRAFTVIEHLFDGEGRMAVRARVDDTLVRIMERPGHGHVWVVDHGSACRECLIKWAPDGDFGPAMRRMAAESCIPRLIRASSICLRLSGWMASEVCSGSRRLPPPLCFEACY